MENGKSEDPAKDLKEGQFAGLHGSAYFMQSPWLPSSKCDVEAKAPTYVNLFDRIPRKALFNRHTLNSKLLARTRVAGYTYWKYINFKKRFRLLYNHTYWFRKVYAKDPRICFTICNTEAKKLSRILDFPDLLITSLWYSGAGYQITDRISVNLIIASVLGKDTGYMTALKKWRKVLRRSFQQKEGWINPPPCLSILNRHPLRKYFENTFYSVSEVWKCVCILTETRSTGTCTDKMMVQAYNKFKAIVTLPVEEEFNPDYPVDFKLASLSRQPSLYIAKTATYEFSRTKGGRLGFYMDILTKGEEIPKVTLTGVGDTLISPPRYNKEKDFNVCVESQFGKIPNFYINGFADYIYSYCYMYYVNNTPKEVLTRVIVVKERGKARILLVPAGWYSTLVYPFQKLGARTLESIPELRNSFTGTSDGYMAYRSTDIPAEGEYLSSVFSDLSVSTDYPDQRFVIYLINLYMKSGIVSEWYGNLLKTLFQLPKVFKDTYNPDYRRRHDWIRTTRSLPMGDPGTKNLASLGYYLCTRRTIQLFKSSMLLTKKIKILKVIFFIKGDDIVLMIYSSVPGIEPARVFKALFEDKLKAYTLLQSEDDTGCTETFTYFCESSFRLPRDWKDQESITRSLKREDVFIDNFKGRFVLPLFKPPQCMGGRDIGELPASKITSLCKQRFWYGDSTFSSSLIANAIEVQKITFRIDHLRDFFYPFPLRYGGKEGYLGTNPPEVWAEKQENMFYWCYALEAKLTGRFFSDLKVPSVFMKMRNSFMTRVSNRGFSQKMVIKRFNIEEYGYTPIWSARDEREYKTGFYKHLVKDPLIVSEDSIISRIRSYQEMTGMDVAVESKAISIPNIPFPERLKPQVWAIYQRGFRDDPVLGSWKFYEFKGPLLNPLFLDYQGTNDLTEESTKIIQWINSDRKAEPPFGDCDLQITYSIRDDLSGHQFDKRYIPVVHVQSRDVKMSNSIIRHTSQDAVYILIINSYYPIVDHLRANEKKERVFELFRTVNASCNVADINGNIPTWTILFIVNGRPAGYIPSDYKNCKYAYIGNYMDMDNYKVSLALMEYEGMYDSAKKLTEDKAHQLFRSANNSLKKLPRKRQWRDHVSGEILKQPKIRGKPLSFESRNILRDTNSDQFRNW